MQTTIQISGKTLELLKKVKNETGSRSYDEAITKVVLHSLKRESLAGYLGDKPLKHLLQGLRDKHDRY